MRKSRAFTLVELLVVIGIIALLVGILLPALNAARRQGQAVKCAAALREIGNAFQMYAMESKGWYPASKLSPVSGRIYNINGYDYTDTKTPYWPSFLAKYVTKSKQGYAAGGSGDLKDARDRSVFWGCTSFEAYTSTSTIAIGGLQPVQVGYGMNLWPTYAARYPTAGNVFNTQ